MPTLVEHARERGLVVFAGAGISMPAPSSLPSWYAFNDIVLSALTRRVDGFVGADFSEHLQQQLVATRRDTRYFSPDYQAQIIEDEIGSAYFRILQALDTPDRNACHDSVAALAAQGFVAAIVTTNFDRLLERALTAAGVEHRVLRQADEYTAFRPGEGPITILKVHGSVELPDSMVDTLRQRLVGRPEALEAAVAELLRRHHVLFAGFSGADLDYDEGYLGLRAAADQNHGFTCLVRPGTTPSKSMASLAEAWGPGARFEEAMLPDWFGGLLHELGVSALDSTVPAVAVDRVPEVRAHADQWVASLGTMVASAILAELLESGGWPELAYEVLVKTYNAGGDDRDPEAPGYSRYNYQLGRRLLERGQFDCPVDPYYGRKAKRDGLDPFTANDCYQCLNRGMSGEFADAFIAMGLYEAYRGAPGRAAGRLRSVRSQAIERHALVPFIDACRTLAIVYDMLMQYGDGLEWLELAHTQARRVGDEPRRASVCAELARFLAMKQRFDEAHARLDEGTTIAERLQLRITRMELASAEVSLLVEEREGAKAIERLGPLLTALDAAGRRPTLLRTLLDAGYASYQARDQALLERVQDRIYDLADGLHGYSPLVALMMTRLALWSGDAASAQRMGGEARRLGEMFQNPRVAAEAADLTGSGT